MNDKTWVDTVSSASHIIECTDHGRVDFLKGEGPSSPWPFFGFFCGGVDSRHLLIIIIILAAGPPGRAFAS